EMRTDAMIDDSVKLVIDIFNGRIFDVKR
ncbi:MAG: hypothetical protein QG588_1168, partial [Candidatus Poribacteria bacterium]|nr:hypothetical protein [Candidatus Poribacteria bacterium]